MPGLNQSKPRKWPEEKIREELIRLHTTDGKITQNLLSRKAPGVYSALWRSCMRGEFRNVAEAVEKISGIKFERAKESGRMKKAVELEKERILAEVKKEGEDGLSILVIAQRTGIPVKTVHSRVRTLRNRGEVSVERLGSAKIVYPCPAKEELPERSNGDRKSLPLSEKELQFLELLSLGESPKEIAKKLRWGGGETESVTRSLLAKRKATTLQEVVETVKLQAA